jgi:AcrR family transcriptional regulator
VFERRSFRLKAMPQKNRPGQAKSRRAKGRPLSSDNWVGRQALVAATRELLKTKAPGDVSRRDIANFAGVDPALIRYYFGDKDKLLTAAASEIRQEMHALIAKGVASARTSREKLARRTQAVLQMHTINPHLNQLIIQQILYGKGKEARRTRKEMVANSIASLRDLVESGRRRGELRQVDHRFLHIALIGMCDFFFTGRPVLEEIFGRRAVNAELTRAYGDFISALVWNGIGKEPAARARATKSSPRRRQTNGARAQTG